MKKFNKRRIHFMAKSLSYKEIKIIVESKSRELVTTEDEFYHNKNKSSRVPSQTHIEIRCKCLKTFITTLNQFKDKGKISCNDCNSKDKKSIKKIYPVEMIEKVIEMYKSNTTLENIGKYFKIRRSTISTILKDNGVKVKNNTDYKTSEELATNRKYNFDQSFFEEINTEHKAYWLGFIYADGNVYIKNYNEGKSKGGKLEIGLKRSDEYHLHNFIKDIQADVSVEYRDILLNENKYEACRVNINSIRLAKDLIKHGCIPNKSLQLKFPKTVPTHLLHHFIRGYIDGDGCIAFYSYEKFDSFHVGILGTKEFLESLKIELQDNGIKSNKINREKSKAFSMNLTGRDNLVKLYDYLYADATIFLGRKIDKFREALIYFNKDFAISETARLFYSI